MVVVMPALTVSQKAQQPIFNRANRFIVWLCADRVCKAIDQEDIVQNEAVAETESQMPGSAQCFTEAIAQNERWQYDGDG